MKVYPWRVYLLCLLVCLLTHQPDNETEGDGWENKQSKQPSFTWNAVEEENIEIIAVKDAFFPWENVGEGGGEDRNLAIFLKGNYKVLEDITCK